MTLRRGASLTGTSKIPPLVSSDKKRVLVIFGTRPEAIKLCPLISAMRTAGFPFEVQVCVTGQHREMLHQVLNAFHVQPDFDLDAMTSGQSLNLLSSRLLAGLEPVFESVRPLLTVVQGDTTSTLCGALASFHRGVPVAHVEAGLRTYDALSPFPEESNRTLTDRLSQLHFAATQWAADNLLREGFSPDSVTVTGNTGIDAVLSVYRSLEAGELRSRMPALDNSKRLILVTAHRRESFGVAIREICQALSVLAGRGDVQIVWPVHPNPEVKVIVEAALQDKPNVLLCAPLDYVPFVDLMRRSYLILTDSGGIQEEAPSLGKPVLVLRAKTERPEALACGSVRLAGTGSDSILREATKLLDHPEEYARMAHHNNPYGDGQASVRIAERMAAFLAQAPTN